MVDWGGGARLAKICGIAGGRGSVDADAEVRDVGKLVMAGPGGPKADLGGAEERVEPKMAPPKAELAVLNTFGIDTRLLNADGTGAGVDCAEVSRERVDGGIVGMAALEDDAGADSGIAGCVSCENGGGVCLAPTSLTGDCSGDKKLTSSPRSTERLSRGTSGLEIPSIISGKVKSPLMTSMSSMVSFPNSRSIIHATR